MYSGFFFFLGKLEEYRNLNSGQRVRVNFDVGKRIKLMQNHTGTHLLNCALNKMFEFTRQKSRYEKMFIKSFSTFDFE